MSHRVPSAFIWSRRWALIVYRDTTDDYIVRDFDFSSLSSFQENLDDQQSGGGGDFPEAVDESLAATSGPRAAWTVSSSTPSAPAPR